MEPSLKLSDIRPEETILVACECSGRIRDALIRLGYKAVSCDLQASEVPGPHIQGDVRELVKLPWKGLIAHPTCTYLTNAGVRWLYNRDGSRNEPRWAALEEGAEFFRLFDEADHIPVRAIENPVMHKYAVALVGRKHDQVVQPWWFGDEAFKGTGWWLHGLPPLVPTNKLVPPKPGTEEHKRWSAIWLCPPGPERAIIRSRFHPGHAAAVASQWGPLFKREG